jgi:integrase
MRLLDACADHFRPIVETALFTRMRRGELFGLTWDMIVARKIRLPGWLTKNGEPRNIPVSDRLNEVLTAQRRKNQMKSQHVFCMRTGAVSRIFGQPSKAPAAGLVLRTSIFMTCAMPLPPTWSCEEGLSRRSRLPLPDNFALPKRYFF